MRATNGVLNCHSGKISGKTVPRHVQPEQIWVHAVVQQNSETSPKDHDKQEKGISSSFWYAIFRFTSTVSSFDTFITLVLYISDKMLPGAYNVFIT